MCGILAVLFNKMQSISRRYLVHQLKKIHWRGPDNTKDHKASDSLYMGFTRLMINDLTQQGDQPMINGPIKLICNGEIYNFKKLRDQNQFVLKSGSDCEIISHLYLKYGMSGLLQMLEGYYCFVLYDSRSDVTYAARDYFGVRPMFQGTDVHGNTGFSSEAKCLVDWCNDVKPFPPSHYWDSKTQSFTRYFKLQNELRESKDIAGLDIEKQLLQIKSNFYNAVEKRLMSERPIGTFLSGGLDSSIITAILAKTFGKHRLNTFSIGMEGSPDLKYAGEVSTYCKTTHHNVNFTPEDGIDVLDDLIYQLESYDVTTIRASVGMYLLSKYIRKHSNCTVIYSGEGSDEVTQGYLYFHLQPSAVEAAVESQRLVEDLYLYDNLRCDRATAAHGLEVRVPFLDHIFVQSYLNLPVDYRKPINGIEKYTFRNLWKDDALLPDSILWRKKVAFSDGVSSQQKSFHKLLQEYVENIISDKEFAEESAQFIPKPISKEALYYRRIYNKYYGGFNLIPYYWVPKWTGQANPDPSARNLAIYSE